MLGLWIAWRAGHRRQRRRDERERDELLDEIEYLRSQLDEPQDDSTPDQDELDALLRGIGALITIVFWLVVAVIVLRSG